MQVSDTAESAGEDPSLVEDERDPDGSNLPLDTVFDILKNERRRLVLEYLKENGDEEVTTGELAEHIAAYENDISRSELNAQQRKRVYIGLYQCHLPKMDDTEVVEFNQDRGHAALGPNADQLAPYLDAEQDENETEELAGTHFDTYVALSVIGGVLFVAARAAGAPMIADLALLGLVVAVPLLVRYTSRQPTEE